MDCFVSTKTGEYICNAPLVLFPDGTLAARLIVYPQGDALYALGDGRLMKFSATGFPLADQLRGQFTPLYLNRFKHLQQSPRYRSN